MTGVTRTLDLDIQPHEYQSWVNGELIQNCMPHLSVGEREFLLTGVTDDEWSKFIGLYEGDM
jgi:7,8-dihydro-6-hydroxymethylpterin-pyrophosphokinase